MSNTRPATTRSPSSAHDVFKRAAPVVFTLALLAADVALAQSGSYPGRELLNFAKNFIIAPLGLFAIVVAVAGAMFKPDFVKSGIWAAVICAVLFFIINQADTVMNAVKR